jgi:hypothetical protein
MLFVLLTCLMVSSKITLWDPVLSSFPNSCFKYNPLFFHPQTLCQSRIFSPSHKVFLATRSIVNFQQYKMVSGQKPAKERQQLRRNSISSYTRHRSSAAQTEKALLLSCFEGHWFLNLFHLINMLCTNKKILWMNWGATFISGYTLLRPGSHLACVQRQRPLILEHIDFVGCIIHFCHRLRELKERSKAFFF